jgi:hypothetical protein
MVQPKRGHKHANHFHVRIYCPADDRPHCRDSAPYWPWYRTTEATESEPALPSLEAASALESTQATLTAQPVTAPAQAI